MQPVFSRSLGHTQAGAGHFGARSDSPQTTGERVSAPELSKPCPSYPDNISHQLSGIPGLYRTGQGAR